MQKTCLSSVMFFVAVFTILITTVSYGVFPGWAIRVAGGF